MQIDLLAKLKMPTAGIVRTYGPYPDFVDLLNHLIRDTRDDASERIKASFVTSLIDA